MIQIDQTKGAKGELPNIDQIIRWIIAFGIILRCEYNKAAHPVDKFMARVKLISVDQVGNLFFSLLSETILIIN